MTDQDKAVVDGLKRLAALAGKRGCCHRVCVHRQAAIAAALIERLEAELKEIRVRLAKALEGMED